MREKLRDEGLYDFTTSRLIAPAEVIDSCKESIKLIEEICQELETYDFTAEVVELKPLLRHVHSVLDLLRRLEYPVNQHDFNTSNEQAPKQRRPSLSWEDMRRLYGTPNFSNVKESLLELLRKQTPEAKKLLIDSLHLSRQELLQNIENFGGDLETRVAKVTQSLRLTDEVKAGKVEDLHTNAKSLLSACNWHKATLGKVEERVFRKIIPELRQRFRWGDLSEIQFAEFGVGNARMAELLDDLYATPADKEGRLHGLYTPNFIGIEYAESNLKEARERIKNLLEKRGVPHLFNPDQIIHGNFLEQLLLIRPGTIHFAFSMMRTAFHGITERQLVIFLEGISNALVPGDHRRPGGVFLMDTVRRRPLHNVSKGAQSRLEDLMDLYYQLARMYAERYQALMPPGIDLKRSATAATECNTAGNKIESNEGFYPREIMTQEYLEYIINRYELDFSVREMDHHLPPIMEGEFQKDPAIVALGRKWISDNLLERYYSEEIKRRLNEENGISEDILEIVGPDTERIMNHVAYHMVVGYPSVYLLLEKKKIAV